MTRSSNCFRHTLALVFAAALAACSPPVDPPQEPPASPQAEAARPGPETEEIGASAVGFVAACAVCHGANGEGNARLGAPRIGGMKSWYVARQLRNFKRGIRAATDKDVFGTQMRAIALVLDDDEVIRDLGLHFESLMPMPAPDTVMGDVEHGRELYTVCVACHMEDGRGSAELNTPDIVDQHDWYTLRQMENFRNGLRGTHSEDEFGAQMIPIMNTLESRQDVLDLVAYINTL